MKKVVAIGLSFIAWAGAWAQAPAQNPPGAAQGRGAGARAGGGGGAYPDRPPADPAVVDRGKAVFGVNCAFCHGSDARGGEGGPNLIRSQLVLNDQKGELIAPVILNGRPDAGMPKFDLTAAQTSDIATFLHSFRVNGRDAARNRPQNTVFGDAKAGEQYFQSKCTSCHSATGDLKGIGGKISDPKTLQQTWMAPGGGGRGQAPVARTAPTTATVTLASGQKVEGRLVSLDDFTVTLTDSEGANRSFRISGGQPKVEVHDPLEPHRQLLPVYTDKDIHNLTAYLASLK